MFNFLPVRLSATFHKSDGVLNKKKIIKNDQIIVSLVLSNTL